MVTGQPPWSGSLIPELTDPSVTHSYLGGLSARRNKSDPDGSHARYQKNQRKDEYSFSR